jgi:hypothetical protein
MTQLKRFIAPTALLALTVAAAPAFAQEKYHGREKQAGQSSGDKAQPRGESRPQGGAAPRVETRQETPRAQQPQTQPPPQAQRQQQQPQAQQQQQQPRQTAQPRGENRSNNDRQNQDRWNGNQQRNDANRGNDNRGNDSRGYQNQNGRAVPRTYAPHYAPHYSPRGYGYYGTHTYYRPYVFRPRFTVGFGIYAGYPVPYTYSYASPIFVYGYRAPSAAVMVGPGSPYYGGIAFEMTPYDADIWVDGTYAGRVEDFDGTTQPLTLSAGMHDIEVQAIGYEPMRINVEIQPGQIIPYRGDLRRF